MQLSNIYEGRLEDKFFKVLNEVRGHLSFEEYRNVFLLLLYLKYLNDTSKISEYSSEGIVIPNIAKWDYLINNPAQIGDYLNKAFYELEIHNPQFQGIFSVFDFNSLSYNKDLGRGLKTIIQNLSEFDLSNEEINFGNLFDFFLYQFVRLGGRKSNGIILPTEVVHLMSSFIPTLDKITIYNPFSGLSSFAINLPEDSKYVGQEINSETRSLALLRLLAHNKYSFEIELASSIGHNYAIFSENTFDCIISAPPLNARLSQDQKIFTRTEQRTYEAYTIERAIFKLKNKGKGIFAVSPGFLFNNGPEKKLREDLVQGDLIETVISLPAGIFYNTSIPICLLVLNKSKSQKNEVFFVDGTNCFIGKKSNNRKLDLDRILKILDLRKNSDNSNLISQENLISQDYNLSPRRYIQVKIDQVLDKKENLIELSKVLTRLPKKRAISGVLGRFIRIRDLSDTFKNYTRTFDELEIKEIPRYAYSLPANTLLLASRWNNMKPTYYKGSDDAVFYSTDISIFKINEDIIHMPYLLQELREEYVVSQFYSYTTGAIVPYISVQDLLRIKIQIPSLDKQKERVLYRLALIATEENLKVLDIKEKLELDAADQNSFLRHQIAGSLKSVRKSFEAIKSIVENQIAQKFDDVLDLKDNPNSKLSFGKYLEIMERDLKSIYNSVQRTGKELEFVEFNPSEIDVVKFVSEYCNELNEKKSYPITFADISHDLKEADIKNVYISGDKELLRKMFDNIVENAEKHGFNNLTSIKNKIDVQLIFDFDQMTVQIDFSNTGNPLPEEVTFESFKRKGGRAGENGGDGTGGWYINEIMKLHSGKLSFTDETEGDGIYGIKGYEHVTTIELEFPIRAE